MKPHKKAFLGQYRQLSHIMLIGIEMFYIFVLDFVTVIACNIKHEK